MKAFPAIAVFAVATATAPASAASAQSAAGPPIIIDKADSPMITVTAHAIEARRHIALGDAEAARADKAGHKGPIAMAAHRAAAAEYRKAADQHEAAARKLG